MLAGLALAGMGQCLAGWRAVRRFAAQGGGSESVPAEPRAGLAGGGAQDEDPWPPVLLLKPLHGDEPLLESALASMCAQDYPRLRIVCGVQRADDPAIAVVERLRRRFAGVDLRLVVDATPHGANRKVANLINMMDAVPPAGPDEVVVISDSDIHAGPDWLRRVAGALAVPGVGLATTLYVGLAARGGRVERLGCCWITHTFLPGVLLARGMGRQDCLGATMALRAGTLAEIGGLRGLADHLADDNELGRRVRARGLGVALAGSVPATTVAEGRLAALWRHELRWGRTIRALVPGAFAASAIQYPIFWALAAWAASGAAGWAAWGVVLAWAVRALAARGVDRALGHAGTGVPVGLLPVRDVLSVAVVAAAFLGRRVVWRGQVLRA